MGGRLSGPCEYISLQTGSGPDTQDSVEKGRDGLARFWSLLEGNTFLDLVGEKGLSGSPLLVIDARNSFSILEPVAEGCLIYEEEV